MRDTCNSINAIVSKYSPVARLNLVNEKAILSWFAEFRKQRKAGTNGKK